MKSIKLFEDGDVVFHDNMYYVIEVDDSTSPDIYIADSYIESIGYIAYPLKVYDDHYVVLVDERRRLFVKTDDRDKIEYVGTCFDDVERHKRQIEAERPKTKAMWKVVKTGPRGNMENICCLGDRDEALGVARDCEKENTYRHTYYTVERVDAVVP